MAKANKKTTESATLKLLKNKKVLIGAGLLIALVIILGYSTFAGTVYPTTGPGQTIPPLLKTMRLWTQNRQVPQLRRELNTVCKNTKLPQNISVFDRNVQSKVKGFQKATHSGVDGVVGPNTWYRINTFYNTGRNNILDCKY